MLEAARAGIAFGDRTFSLHQLVGGELGDRLGHAPRRLFKSVGGGIQDIVVAEVIVRRALQAGLTVPLPIKFDTKH
jgi:ornithine cyclodeaminase/alanine dehydrogenase